MAPPPKPVQDDARQPHRRDPEQQHRRGRPVHPAYGSFIVELADDAKLPAVSNLVEIGEIGTTTSEYVFKAAGETLDLDAVQEAWESGIESVFPYRSKGEDKGATVETIDFHAPKKTVYVGSSVAKPHVVIPVFPGNNCEYDSAAAFERAGADVTTLIVNNLRRPPSPNPRRRWSTRSTRARS